MAGFSDTVNTFVEMAKGRNDKVIRALGLKILERLITLSPVGDPKRWKINAAFAASKKEASQINAMRRTASMYSRKSKTGTRVLKSGMKIRPSVPVSFKTKAGKTVSFNQKDWAGRNYTGGRFRGNWQVSLNEPIKTAIDRIDKTGSVTMAAGRAILAMVDSSVSAVYFSNNVPYARRLEFGWSKQAPNGMVRITAIESRQMIREVLGEIKSE